MKTVWIIWGFWPETTSKFYTELNEIAHSLHNTVRPPIMLYNVPILYDIERDFILTWKWIERYLPYLLDAWKILENSWADFIVIPCNSIHILIQELRQAITIPIVSIVEETIDFISKNKLDNVWIISSLATVKSELYNSPLKVGGIKYFIPPDFSQKYIDSIILNLVTWNYSSNEKKILLEIITSLKESWADSIFLACTDLQLIVNDLVQIPVFDTMKILVNSTVDKIYS